MDASRAESILDGYAKWFRDSFDVVEEDSCIRIVSPMLDRFNDHMSVYLMDGSTAGSVIASDLGSTIDGLFASGCDIETTSRKSKLDSVVRGYGLKVNDGEMYVETSEHGIYQALNMLIQGMATIDDLFFTARDNVRGFFTDDVASWLDDNGIRYTDNVQLVGRSGFPAKFDFVIPRTKGSAPERLIKTVNSPTLETVSNALFMWGDVKAERAADSKGYVFLNGDNTKSGSVDQRLRDACLKYDVTPVVWGDIDQKVLAELAA